MMEINKTMTEDIELLKKAYRKHDEKVTLSDGRTIRRRNEVRFNTCSGCVFEHSLGCYCEDGERWVMD